MTASRQVRDLAVPLSRLARSVLRVGLTAVANGMYWSQVSRLPRPARRPGKTHLRPLKRRTRLSSEIFATTYPRGTPAVRFSVVGDQGISNGRVNWTPATKCVQVCEPLAIAPTCVKASH